MKKLIVLALALALVFSLAACGSKDTGGDNNGGGSGNNDVTTAGKNSDNDKKGGNDNKGGDAGEFKSRKDIESTLSNYKIKTESTDGNGNKVVMTELRCAEGYVMIPDEANPENIVYIEYGTGKMYMLNTKEKSGMAIKLDDGGEETYKTFGMGLGAHLFAFENMGNDFKKFGTEKVIGRTANVYEYSLFGSGYKIWVDKATGITLKRTYFQGNDSVTWEVKELKIGGVKLSDLIKLSDYQILDMDNLLSGLEGLGGN